MTISSAGQLDAELEGLMRRLADVASPSNDQQAGALRELESALRALVRRARAETQHQRSEPSAASAGPLDRRFFREILAPELERFWARHKRDLRP